MEKIQRRRSCMKMDIKKVLEIAEKLGLYETVGDLLKTKVIDAGLIKVPVDEDLIKEVKEFLEKQGFDMNTTLKEVVQKLK